MDLSQNLKTLTNNLDDQRTKRQANKIDQIQKNFQNERIFAKAKISCISSFSSMIDKKKSEGEKLWKLEKLWTF